MCFTKLHLPLQHVDHQTGFDGPLLSFLTGDYTESQLKYIHTNNPRAHCLFEIVDQYFSGEQEVLIRCSSKRTSQCSQFTSVHKNPVLVTSNQQAAAARSAWTRSVPSGLVTSYKQALNVQNKTNKPPSSPRVVFFFSTKILNLGSNLKKKKTKAKL